jgi:hypothetical protein
MRKLGIEVAKFDGGEISHPPEQTVVSDREGRHCQLVAHRVAMVA